MANQVLAQDLCFWRKKTRKPVQDLLWCSASQIDGKFNVSIPVTSRAVSRHIGTGAYFDFPFYFDIFGSGSSPVTSSVRYPYKLLAGSTFSGGSLTGTIPIVSDGNQVSNPPNLNTGGQIVIEGAWNAGPATKDLAPTQYLTYGSGGTGLNPSGGIFGKAYIGSENSSNDQTGWLVGGNTALDVFSPRNTINVLDLNASTMTATVISNTAPAVLYPTCCVIATDRFRDRLLFTGGMTSWYAHQKSSFIFNKDGTSFSIADAPQAMTQSAAITLPSSQRVLVTGGIADTFDQSKKNCFTYDTYANTWTAFSPFICPRRQHQLIDTTFEDNASILAVGGNNGTQSTDHTTVHTQNISMGGDASASRRSAWIPIRSTRNLSIEMTLPATGSPVGVISIEISNSGVPGQAGRPLDSIYLAGLTQPSGGAWSCFLDNIQTTALYLAIVYTRTSGGVGANFTDGSGSGVGFKINYTANYSEGPGLDPIGIPLNTCEILTPEGGWVRTGSMSLGRYDFGMTALPDGRILVCGGVGWNPSFPGLQDAARSSYELNSCEVYNPETGFWTPIAPMQDPHSSCVCSYVPFANKVYVYGGFTSKKIEYLDLESMTWHSSAFTLPQALLGASPLAMRNGFMALFGGANYNFDTNVFTLNLDTSIAAKGSSFNAVVPNQPEYTRYDGLNGIWDVNYKAPTYQLVKDQIGDMSNTVNSFPDGTRATLVNIGDTTQPTKLADMETIGPFILDPEQPFGLSGPSIHLGDGLLKGKAYNTIKISSGGMSVGECWLVFDYGYEGQVGPVQCLGHIDDQTLLIEPGFKFTKNVPAQCEINVLFQKGSYGPEETVRGSWLTASNAGRAVAVDLINRISAAGIDLTITTRYPGDSGLGGEGQPVKDSNKLSDIVEIYGSDDVDAELAAARNQ